MRVVQRKLIPIIVLLILLVGYFSSELVIISKVVVNAVKNNCFIADIEKKECNALKIYNYYPKQISIGITNPLTLKFDINRRIDEIDLVKSNIKVYASPGAVVTEEELKADPMLFAITQVVSQYSFADTNVSKVGSNVSTSITIVDKQHTYLEGSLLCIHLNVYDKEGKSTFGTFYTTTAKTPLDDFIASYAYLLQFLVWYFAIFGVALKSISWSVVYDSKTKDPISRAIVRIFSNGKLLQTVVTGQTGVISTKLDKGEYTLNVIHPNFTFPSKILPGKNDGQYKNIYHGESFRILKDKSTLKFNIPMDEGGSVVKEKFLSSTKNAMLYIVDTYNPYFLVFIAVGRIIMFTGFAEVYSGLAVSILLIGIQQFMRFRQRKTPGIVVDEQGKPLSNIVINLYDSEWNKLVESKTTDAKGAYEFIVPNDSYYIKIENGEYKIEGLDENGRLEIKPANVGSRTVYINQKIVLIKNK